MTGLLKREAKQTARFDRMLDDWRKGFPFHRPTVFSRDWFTEDMIRVDEYQEQGTLVVRAELPGIDPDKDVEITVFDGMLRIEAERREEEETEAKGYVRQELSYGSFTRTLPLPEGVTESDITASYKDGILEIRIPAPAPERATKISVSKS